MHLILSRSDGEALLCACLPSVPAFLVLGALDGRVGFLAGGTPQLHLAVGAVPQVPPLCPAAAPLLVKVAVPLTRATCFGCI